MLASYRASINLQENGPEAFVEPFRVGVAMREMPAWLDEDEHVNLPLEESYQAAWQTCLDATHERALL